MILWVKALHVIAVIAWMAGMLYLPRLFVYHADAPKARTLSETFKVMERRLLKAIINPSMILVFITGIALAYLTGILAGGLAARRNSSWFSVSAGCTAILPAACGAFAADANVRPARFLSGLERSSDGAHDRDRRPGRGEAVLGLSNHDRPGAAIGR